MAKQLVMVVVLLEECVHTIVATKDLDEMTPNDWNCIEASKNDVDVAWSFSSLPGWKQVTGYLTFDLGDDTISKLYFRYASN